jgi:hypothetical protein
MIEKPPLDENLLIHFGVKGMKWGRRKKRPDEAERSKIFNKANAKRAARGALVVGGALAVGALLTKSGRTKAVDLATTNFVRSRAAQAQSKQRPFGELTSMFREVKASALPSPNQMMADARMASVRNAVDKSGAQRLTDQAWRDSARLSQLRRDMDSTTNSLLNGNLAALAKGGRGG